jgi:hypothetical protein
VFWRAVDRPEEGPVQSALSWRDQLNPDGLWIDEGTGKTWSLIRAFSAMDRATVTNLVAGEYRVVASAGELGAVGISEPIRLDEATPKSAVDVQLESGPSLTVLAVEDQSGEPIDAAQSLLRRENGLPITRWSGWPWALWMREGRIVYENLAPGRYQLSVGRIPWSFGTPDYAPEWSPISVVVRDGQDQALTVRLHAVEPTETEIKERWPYVITGQVRNADGNGMAGVAIATHIGIGTLMEGGCVFSDSHGSYTLRFPAFSKELFVVVAAPRQHGFFEKNLSRHGDLLPLWTDHVPQMTWGHPPARWIIAGKPYPLDFVMLPAATVRGTLLDVRGGPMRLRRISVTGPVLPPASNVFASCETDDDGKFQFDNLPTGMICRFELSADDAVETTFDEAGLHRLVIERSANADGQLLFQVRRVDDQ